MIFNFKHEFQRYINASAVKTIGITSGCYDLIHPLHVEYLNKCRCLCDELYVLIDSDRLVREHKNKTPLINEQDRAFMIDNQKSTTAVLIINSLEEMVNCIKSISSVPNRDIVVFKHNTTIYGKELIEYGDNVKNVLVPDIIRFESSTEIKNFLVKH